VTRSPALLSAAIEIRSEHIPPSLNACYRNATLADHKRGRIKTQRYREWLTAFGWDVKIAMRGQRPILGPYTIKIILSRASRHKLSDVMNREKPVSDALQELGVIGNDNLCESGTVCWADSVDPIRVEIWPYVA
jgi:hypothetical protein